MRRSNQTGFTLLEAIVSIALFSIVGTALLGWVNSNLFSIGRIEAAQLKTQQVANALSLVKTINPMTEPNGEISVADLTVQWDASLREPERDGVNRFGTPGLYRVGLYDMQVTLSYRGEYVSDFDVRQIGYRQVRQPGQF